MRCFTAQFFAAVLASSVQIFAADTLFPYLMPSVDPTIGKEDLDCICQAFDAKSAFQEGANPDKCAEDFNKILSANLAIISNNITLETCKDRRQQLPQDYCGYPNDLTPFSVDKDSSKLCSSTSDKEICAYQTFEQPDTPCYWSSGRQCYWNLTTATCQGTLSKWFIQAYGLSSDTETICSKQTTKSKCRSTYMLKEHCTSSSLDGEDRDKVCASQTELFACSQTRFSAVRACKWQAKFSGMEATHASCCTSSPYQRPLAGIIWCGFSGLSYVSDGRISSRIGIFTCDDVAGTFIRYQQSRQILMDMFGSAYVLKIDNACCAPSGSLPGSFTVFASPKSNLISMHPTAVPKLTSFVSFQSALSKGRAPTRYANGSPYVPILRSSSKNRQSSKQKSTLRVPIQPVLLKSRKQLKYAIITPSVPILASSPKSRAPMKHATSAPYVFFNNRSNKKATSYVPMQPTLLKSPAPTRHATVIPAAIKPNSIIAPQYPGNQEPTSNVPMQPALFKSPAPARHASLTPAAIKPKSIIAPQYLSNKKPTSYVPILPTLFKGSAPTKHATLAPPAIRPKSIIAPQYPSNQYSYVPIQPAILKSRTPTGRVNEMPYLLRPISIIAPKYPSNRKSTSYIPIQPAILKSRTPTERVNETPSPLRPISIIAPIYPSNRKSTSYIPIQPAILKSRTPTERVNETLSPLRPISIIAPIYPSNRKSTSYIPIQPAILKSRTPTERVNETPSPLRPISIIAPKYPSNQKRTSYVPIQPAMLRSRTPTGHANQTPSPLRPMSIIAPQYPSGQKSTSYATIQPAIIKSRIPTERLDETPSPLRPMSIIAPQFPSNQKRTSYVPIQPAILKSRIPTRDVNETPPPLRPMSIIAPQYPSGQKSTSYIPIQPAIIKSRIPTGHANEAPSLLRPMRIIAPQYPNNQKTSIDGPFQDALEKSRIPSNHPAVARTIISPMRITAQLSPSSTPSTKEVRAYDPAANWGPIYSISDPLRGKPAAGSSSTQHPNVQESTLYAPVQPAILKSRTPTGRVNEMPYLLRPISIIAPKYPSRKSTSYIPIEPAILKSRIPTGDVNEAPLPLRPMRIIAPQYPNNQKTSIDGPFQDAIEKSRIPSNHPAVARTIISPMRITVQLSPSSTPSTKEVRAYDPAANWGPIYSISDPLRGKPAAGPSSTSIVTLAPFSSAQSPNAFNPSPNNDNIENGIPRVIVHKPISVIKRPQLFYARPIIIKFHPKTRTNPDDRGTRAPRPFQENQPSSSKSSAFDSQAPVLDTRASAPPIIWTAVLAFGTATALLALPLVAFIVHTRRRWS